MTHSYVPWLIRICYDSFVRAMTHVYDIPQISVRVWRRQRAVSLYVRQAFNSLACSLTAWIEVFWFHVPWLVHVLHDSDSCISAMAHLYISWVITLQVCHCFRCTHSYVPCFLYGVDWGFLFAWLIAWVNFSCLTWMSHVPYEWVMSHMNESCLTTHWYATCIVTHSYTACLIRMCHHYHDSLTCLQRGTWTSWIYHMCHDSWIWAMTPSYAMTHSFVCHDSFIRVQSVCAITHASAPWLSGMLHDSIIRVQSKWTRELQRRRMLGLRWAICKWWVISHMNESRHIRLSHGTYMNTSSHACMLGLRWAICKCWVVSHMTRVTWQSRGTYMNTSSHAPHARLFCAICKWWVVSHIQKSRDIWMRQVTYAYMNESCHIHE